MVDILFLGHLESSNNQWNQLVDYHWMLKLDNQGDTVWTKKEQGRGHYGHQTNDGGYISCGLYYKGFGNGLANLVKFNNLGDTLWTKKYDFLQQTVGPYYVEQTNDNGYIMSGVNLNNKACIIKTDYLGDTLWTKIFPGGSFSISKCVIESSDGSFVAVGGGYEINHSSSPQSLVVLKISQTGNTIWSKFYPESQNLVGSGQSETFFIDETNDGFIAVGKKHRPQSQNDYGLHIMKLNSIGDTVWTRTLDKPQSINSVLLGDEWGTCIRQVTTGGYIVSGINWESPGTGNGNVGGWLIKTDENGFVCTHDTIVTINNNTLTYSGFSPNTSFQWLDCNNNFSMISGATSANYTSTLNGNFALKISGENCIDTLACVQLIISGSNNLKKTNCELYPNPTNENITISVNNFNGNIQTEVFDLIGNKLQTTNETTISLRDYSKGIYILKVAYGNRVQEVKVIKD